DLINHQRPLNRQFIRGRGMLISSQLQYIDCATEHTHAAIRPTDGHISRTEKSIPEDFCARLLVVTIRTAITSPQLHPKFTLRTWPTVVAIFVHNSNLTVVHRRQPIKLFTPNGGAR